jgi:F-type H+-transporting ATPase subunit epsilon
MAETFEFQIVTPERQLLKEQVEEAQIPGKNGYLGVLPGHAPLLSELGTGYLYFVIGGKKNYFSVHGGFLEVLPDRVKVLANAAERADEIDVERAQRAMERAQQELINPALGVDPAVALAAIARAQARLDAAARRTTSGGAAG